MMRNFRFFHLILLPFLHRKFSANFMLKTAVNSKLEFEAHTLISKLIERLSRGECFAPHLDFACQSLVMQVLYKSAQTKLGWYRRMLNTEA